MKYLYAVWAGLVPALFLLCLFGAPTHGQCETHAIEGGFGQLGVPDAHFCLAIQGDTIAVSDQVDTSIHTIEIFTRSGSVWTGTELLEAADALGLDGDTVVGGSPFLRIPGNPLRSGRVRVSVRSGSTWSFEQEILTTPREEGHFGFSVAISGDTIVIGQPGSGIANDQPGDARVFVRSGTTWSLEQVLTPSDRIVGLPDRFGHSVAIEGDRIVVGSPRPTPSATERPGAVFVFERSGTTWTETDTFSAAVPMNLDGFGAAVSLDGGQLAVGEYGHPPVHSPAVHVFLENAGDWDLQQEIPLDGGRSVALQGDLLLAEVLSDDFAGGGAYLYERTGTSWNLKKKLYGSVCDAGDLFGTAVALDGQTAAVVGPLTPQDDGQLFVYDLDETGCPGIAFTGSPTTGHAPLTVNFADLSTGSVTTWDWDFGDGDTSVLQHPSHVFQPGLFTVDLVVSGPGGTERLFEPDYVDVLPHFASATLRNGTGLNNSCYANTTLPILGTSWDTQVDHSGHPGTIFTVLSIKATAVTGPVIPAGEILVANPKYFRDAMASSGTVDTHSLAIPLDVSFSGVFAATQAIIVDNLGSFELCNAVDLILGV